MPPMARGRLAAARLPKITSSRMSSTGMEMPSARPMSEVTCLLIADMVGTWPPTWVDRPGAARWPAMAWKFVVRAESVPPASSRTAYEAWPPEPAN